MHDFLVFMIGSMILYKSCIQLVFSMLGKDFTSELLKTWSLHLVGVLMLGKEFTSDLLKTWSLHLVGVLMLGKDFTSELLKTRSLHLVGVLMLGKDFTSDLLKTWSLHLVGVLMLGKDFTSELLKTWSLHLVGVLMLGKDFTSDLLKTWSLLTWSAACSAAHATQKPNTSYRLLFLKLPPPPCAVLLVSVNQNEAKVSAAFRWWFGLRAWHRHDFLEIAFRWGKADFQHTGVT